MIMRLEGPSTVQYLGVEVCVARGILKEPKAKFYSSRSLFLLLYVSSKSRKAKDRTQNVGV